MDPISQISPFTLEYTPDEILIHILNSLSKRDLLACRLVSFAMREKIDRLFNPNFCVILGEKALSEFSKKPILLPTFQKMRVESSVFSFNPNKTLRTTLRLRPEYFESVTDLEFTESISRHNFHQIINLTRHVRVLRVSSAVLGGAENLFGKISIKPKKSKSPPKPSSFLAKVKTFFQNNWLKSKETPWTNLIELHIRLDYVSPSTTHFSPNVLVQNLTAIQHLLVPNLAVFSVLVQESQYTEMFFFTINSLLNAIPVIAYETLKSVSISSPKFRPQSKDNQKKMLNSICPKFDKLQLSDFLLKISAGYNHETPVDLSLFLLTQVSLKHLTVVGIKDTLFPAVIDQCVARNKTTLKMLNYT